MVIKLEKRQKISLEKENGVKLKNICAGINWVTAEREGLFDGKIDLDASCATFDEHDRIMEVIYFGNLKSVNSSIRHSGDDFTGNIEECGGMDGEVISIDLEKLPDEVSKIVFVLNSFRGHDFKTVAYASIRICEGSSAQTGEVFASCDIVNNDTFAGCISMIMGIFYKQNGKWYFCAIGETTMDRNLQEILSTVASEYLQL